MSEVLRFPIKENGLYSSLPYAAMWVASILMGFWSDHMINKNQISITNARKLFTTIGDSINLILPKKILILLFAFSFGRSIDIYRRCFLCWMQQTHCRHPLHSCHGNDGRFLPWNESQLAGLVAQLCWIIDGYDEWHWSFDWSHWVNFVFFSHFVKN